MDNLDSEDQLERVKAWWKTYGGAVTIGVVLGVALIAGVNFWKQHRGEQAQAAAGLYEQLLSKNTDQRDAAKTLAKQLKDQYAATVYAGKAALYLAKLSFDAKDLTDARSQLQWAIDHAKEPAMRHVARLRLARLMLAQGEIDAAWKLANVKDRDGFDSSYEELKGDILLKQNKPNEARTAYRAARDALSPNSGYGRVLDMKLAELGPKP